MKKINIAIDGPAGAGKSTVAKLLAEKFHYTYIDTGAMYRALTWLVLKKHGENKVTATLDSLLPTVQIALVPKSQGLQVLVNNMDVTTDIRTPAVTALVSQVAQYPPVRHKMVELQQKMAQEGGVVMDGRDIASRVLPDAELKIFLTASADERAKRRLQDLNKDGYTVSIETLKQEIIARDKADSERKISPLVQTPDAVLVDTTALSLPDVIKKISALAQEKISS